jgi:ankyrin repeat protein
VEVVEALIASGAGLEVECLGSTGGKPLHWAAERSPATVRTLLDFGANPNSRNQSPTDQNGNSPLHASAAHEEQCFDCAKLLLLAGADISAVNAKGETALDLARFKGRSRMVAFLASQK